MRVLPVLTLAALLPMGLGAATTGEEDTIVINPISDTDFEVIQGRTSKAGYFWCGAATFIERRQGRSELTPIYLKRPRGPSLTAPGRAGVVFSTSAAGLSGQGDNRLTLSVERPGQMLKSVQARRFCRDAFTRSTK